MKKTVLPMSMGNYTLRLIKEEDINNYYESGFSFEDEEINRCTGSSSNVDRVSIEKYVHKIVTDDTRYDFLIINDKNEIIGESVINEIDWENKCANYRVCMFKSMNCGHGIGSKAIAKTIEFGFETLKLNRIELEVFDFNTRAYKAYLKVGFIKEGVKRQGIIIHNDYHNVIIMSILAEDYEKQKGISIMESSET